jgi:Heavy metal binding domain
MDDNAAAAAAYICPMHSAVRQSTPGKCPKCGMALVPEDTHFALLRHMLGNPLHIVIMVAVMAAVMAAAMMLMR